ncbi:MAG TPA: T9SS type A sorting domain-containing protein [Candidatus Kapabacteria bacterium]|nr:T9SS type A sorting domain-containing protein [Candidatus Kapabacteria bacterium]
MKKIIILFLMIFSTELFSQSWELMYKEDFLYYDSTTQSSGNFNFDCFTIKNDSIVISRKSYSDTLFLIYEFNKKKWSYITKDEIWSRFKNDSLFDLYSKCIGFNQLILDSNNNIWCGTNGNVLNILKDTIIEYKKIYDKSIGQYFDIYGAVYDIKIDANNDIWAIVNYRHPETYLCYCNVCKLKDGIFESIYTVVHAYSQDASVRRIAFDKLGKVWCTIADTLYLFENEELSKKIFSYDFPDGYGFFTRIAVDSKNVVYALNHSCMLYVIDKDSMYAYNYIQDTEQHITSLSKYYWMCIDSSDNVWVTGLATCNLYKFDTEKNWTRYDVPGFSTAVDENCCKWGIEADKNGRIWIPAQSGGSNGYGMYVFDPKPVSVEEEKAKVEANGLPDVWVYNLFPNPAENTVTLDFFLHRNEVENLEMSLYNVMGMKIKEINEHYDYDKFYMLASVNFSVAGLPKGGYIVTLKAGNTKIARLLIVGF